MSISTDRLHVFNNKFGEYPKDKCIHQLIEEQVDAAPDKIAVVFGEEKISCLELNRRANKLAHYLLTMGAGPDIPTAVLLPRSIEMIIAWLAVLKTGGAYVPLDPSYPQQRLNYMLADSEAPLLLTSSAMNAFPSQSQAKAVCIDSDIKELKEAPASNPSVKATSDNLAYIVYTSGSTGEPKGVAVTHKAVNRLVCNADYLQVESADRILQASNASFDAATFEIWGSLINGACLVGVSRDILLEPIVFAGFLQKHQITAMFITTALFNQMARLEPGGFNGLRAVLFGGEAADPDCVRRVLENNPPHKLLHVYGPTESTTFATWHEVKTVAADADAVPIGAPISNTSAYILDKNLDPVFDGNPGELYIGGDGLARCYFNEPKLTASRFVPNPFPNFFGAEPGARMYKTGDIVKLSPEGCIVFVGRVDDQVKIRGFRIEPGEIESVLCAHPDVREAVVIVRKDELGEKRLAAYLAYEPDRIVSKVEIRDFVKQKLPVYMTPGAYVVVDAMPLTPNGKIDRRALPDPDWTDQGENSEFVYPRNPIEEKLASIFSEVLGLEQISVSDDFHALGGHSLNATQIIARARNVFDIELPLEAIFEAPVISELAKRIEKYVNDAESRHKESLLNVKRDDVVPLSFAQERIWFLQKLNPDNRAYHFQAVFELFGKLDIPALEKSLSEMVSRHEILRTTFHELDGRAIQKIHPVEKIKIQLEDLSALSEADQPSKIKKILDVELQKSFDLGQLPLIRWKLVKLADKEFRLIHVEHHIIHDGWSFNVFIKELFELYRAFSQGAASPLPELPLQFADFACRQQQWLQSDEAKRQTAYWRKKLSGAPPLLELPTDRPRPVKQRFKGTDLSVEFKPELYEEIKSFSIREGATPFVTLLTAFIVLLYRYSRQEDICVGVSMANRRWRETEGLIGMILNNVVLRNDLSGNPTAGEVLSQMRQVSIEAAANQDLPFDKVVEAVKAERSLSHNPLYQVMFGMHDAPTSKVDLPELKGNLMLGLNNGSAKFDLTITIIPDRARQIGKEVGKGEESLTVIWEYDIDLFNSSTIERMARHYKILLKGFLANPDMRISDLPLLTLAEQNNLLAGSAGAETVNPKDHCIHELFYEIVENRADSTAVVLGTDKLTYGELNKRSNQLARYLQSFGVGPETVAAICVERSFDMVIGLLGILKSGACYLPLDPRYPRERLKFMLKDAASPVLLTQKNIQGTLPEFEGKTIILDGDDRLPISAVSGENVQSVATTDNLAYIIYTSGSTGLPKGVMVSHRALVNHMQWMQNKLPMAQTDRVLQKTAFSFDASVWEFYAPLLTGAQLILARPQEYLDPECLISEIKAHQATVLQLVPSLLQVLTEYDEFQNCTSLKRVFCGGESLSAELATRFLAQMKCSLYNLYGPTEATIDSTFWECKDLKNRPEAPIGHPIDNVKIYILDDFLNLMPVGAPGEVYIGGLALSRGYFKRPGMTAMKFIPDPFSKEPGKRLYRTADVARFLSDGSLEFLGRNDHQVKVRGYRIELGEIESSLAMHPFVREVVVLARKNDSEGNRLEAYIIPVIASQKGDLPPADELKKFIRQKLPNYMVPSIMVFLNEFPLTPSGKIDRNKLKPPENSHSDKNFKPPQTDAEQTIAAIWREVLNLESVSAKDDFFDLGGHSLMVAQVASRLKNRINIDVPLHRLFEYATIERLAGYVEAVKKVVNQQKSSPQTEKPGFEAGVI